MLCVDEKFKDPFTLVICKAPIYRAPRDQGGVAHLDPDVRCPPAMKGGDSGQAKLLEGNWF